PERGHDGGQHGHHDPGPGQPHRTAGPADTRAELARDADRGRRPGTVHHTPGPAMTRRPVGDRGAGSVGLAGLVVPPLVVAARVIGAGRVAAAGGAVEHATTDAARQASLARTPTAARAAAEQTARTTLAEQHLQCRHITVTVDLRGFAAPAGQPAQVAVEVTCLVRLADLGLPGLGDRTLSDRFASPLDPYRRRQ